MSRGDLIVSVFPNYTMLEMFRINGKKKTLVQKHYDRFTLPLSDVNKVDVMDFEAVIQNFLDKGFVKRGKVTVVVFGEDDVMPFEEIDLGITNKRAIKKMLPLEIEDLGDYLSDYDYKYDIVDSTAKVYFLRNSLASLVSEMTFKGSWELGKLVPGYIAYKGMVSEDGMVVDIGRERYNIYTFRGGFLDEIEGGAVSLDYSIEGDVEDSPDSLLSSVEEDVIQYVENYNFTNSVDIDMVYVVFNDNTGGTFTTRDINGVYFDIVKDLRDSFSEEEAKVTAGSNAEIMEYSSISLGITYLGDEAKRYDFSRDRLNIRYRNMLTAYLAFTTALVVMLPLTSLYVDGNLKSLEQEVKSYENNVDELDRLSESLLEGIEGNEKQVDDYNEYVKSLEMLSNADDNYISDVLKFLPENTPASVVFNEMRLEKGSRTLILKGHSESYKDIGSFAIELEEFGDVSINGIDDNELDNDIGYPFEIELRSK